MSTKKLLFVYNAKGGLYYAVTDFAHKILSPATYPCKLCALTYDSFAMKQDWKEFVSKLPVESNFYHVDEFDKFSKTVNKLKNAITTDANSTYARIDAESWWGRGELVEHLPAVFLLDNDRIKMLITKSDIDDCVSLNDLKNLVTSKLNIYDQHNRSDI